mmetsp:Transcript_46509/g.109324  ORF Transcript_46509/g.109324 Transcript_46509/m.109324 type:complete len:263 (-) Transcript_46509:140-928(-)
MLLLEHWGVRLGKRRVGGRGREHVGEEQRGVLGLGRRRGREGPGAEEEEDGGGSGAGGRGHVGGAEAGGARDGGGGEGGREVPHGEARARAPQRRRRLALHPQCFFCAQTQPAAEARQECARTPSGVERPVRALQRRCELERVVELLWCAVGAREHLLDCSPHALLVARAVHARRHHSFFHGPALLAVALPRGQELPSHVRCCFGDTASEVHAGAELLNQLEKLQLGFAAYGVLLVRERVSSHERVVIPPTHERRAGPRHSS